MSINHIPQLLANFLDTVSSGSLAYVPDTNNVHATRSLAAAALLSNGDVYEWPGHEGEGWYCVKCRSVPNTLYLVCLDEGSLHCNCPDHLLRPPGICVHILAACMFHAIQSIDIERVPVERRHVNTEQLAAALA